MDQINIRIVHNDQEYIGWFQSADGAIHVFSDHGAKSASAAGDDAEIIAARLLREIAQAA